MHIVAGDGGADGDTGQQMEDGLQSSPLWRLSPGSSSPLVGTRASLTAQERPCTGVTEFKRWNECPRDTGALIGLW